MAIKHLFNYINNQEIIRLIVSFMISLSAANSSSILRLYLRIYLRTILTSLTSIAHEKHLLRLNNEELQTDNYTPVSFSKWNWSTAPVTVGRRTHCWTKIILSPAANLISVRFITLYLIQNKSEIVRQTFNSRACSPSAHADSDSRDRCSLWALLRCIPGKRLRRKSSKSICRKHLSGVLFSNTV